MGKDILHSTTSQSAQTPLLNRAKDLINNKILIALSAFGIGMSSPNNSFAQQNLPQTYNTDYEAMGYIGQAPNTAIIEMFFVDQNHVHPTSPGYKFDYGAGVDPFIINPTPVSISYQFVDDDGQYADKYRVTIEGTPGIQYDFHHSGNRPGGSGAMIGSIRFDMNGKPIFLDDPTALNPYDKQDFINSIRLVSTETTDAPCPLGYGNFTINLAALAVSDTAWQEPLDPDNMMTVTLIDNTGTQYTETFPYGTDSVTMQVPAGTYTGLQVNGYDFTNSPYFNSQVVAYVPDIDTIAGTFATVTNNPDNTTASFQSPEIVDTSSVDSVEVTYQGEVMYRKKGDPMPKAMTTTGGIVNIGWNNNRFEVVNLNRPALGAADETVTMELHGCNAMIFQGTVEARTIGTGVDQVAEEQQELSVYPNPASDLITIKGLENQNFHYEIMSIDGKIMDYIINHNGFINVADLPQGLYVIQVTPVDGDTRPRVLKFVK